MDDYAALVTELRGIADFLDATDDDSIMWQDGLRQSADALEALTAELAELRRNTGHLDGALVAKALAALARTPGIGEAFDGWTIAEVADIRNTVYEVRNV